MNIPEFIEHLYITYYQQLYNYLMSCFHDTDIAEEVTQDTFLKALIYAPYLKAHPDYRLAQTYSQKYRYQDLL